MLVNTLLKAKKFRQGVRVFIIVLLIMGSVRTQACVCIGNSLKENIDRSNYISLVKVLDIVSIGSKWEYKIKVEELVLYKGSSVNQVFVNGANRYLDSTFFTTCDIDFKIGQEWVVFGFAKNDSTKTNYCSGTFNYKDEFGYRDIMGAYRIEKLNALNQQFNKPLITFLSTKKRLQLFFPNGQLEMDAQFKNGERQGVSRYYYPNGVLRGEQSYNKGKLHGTQRMFFREGTLDNVRHYEYGVEVDSTNYYEFNRDSGRYYLHNTSFRTKTGVMLSSKSFAIPIKYGPPGFIFNSNQHYLRNEVIYDTLTEITTYINYHPNGMIQTQYKLNKERAYVGDEITYDENGYVIKILRMKKGEKNTIIYIDKKHWPNYKEGD